MKRAFFIALVLISLFIVASFEPLMGQEWTEPVNVSNQGIHAMNISMTIDEMGTIHIAWSSKVTDTHWIINYTQSNDNGTTWSEPLDLLKNTNYWMAQPNIVSDNRNILYVTYTYDYLSWTASGRLIKLIIYDGHHWGEPIIVSKDMSSSHYPISAIDHNDRIYVFWNFAFTDDSYYRYIQNNILSEIRCPYPGGNADYFVNAIVDNRNNIHVVGSSLSISNPGYEKLEYFNFDYNFNTWIPPLNPIKDTISVGMDIALNQHELPACIYRKMSRSSGVFLDDTTKHLAKNGHDWSNSTIISGANGTQNYQQLIFDQNNDSHVIERQEIENYFGWFHFFKAEQNWTAELIDSSLYLAFSKLVFYNNNLYFSFGKAWEVEGSIITDIFFTKYDIVTNQQEHLKNISELKIFPNPSQGDVCIEFENSIQQSLNISIFDINGNQIKTLIDKKMPQGQQQVLWDGTKQNGKKVKSGSYLVRLQAGNKTLTQAVEIVR